MTPFVIAMVALVFLMAFFNAVMDATENDPNFNESIFRKLNRKFWLKTVSWEFAKKIFGYKLDAWHLAKSCMVMCIAGALVLCVIIGIIIGSGGKAIYWANYLLFFGGIGLLWNGTFRLFYHIIFKVR
jgi:hypothetical protein